MKSIIVSHAIYIPCSSLVIEGGDCIMQSLVVAVTLPFVYHFTADFPSNKSIDVAGLVASDGADGDQHPRIHDHQFIEIDDKAVSTPLEVSMGGVTALAKHLEAGCADEIEVCRSVWKWIIRHVHPPAPTWQVDIRTPAPIHVYCAPIGMHREDLEIGKSIF